MILDYWLVVLGVLMLSALVVLFVVAWFVELWRLSVSFSTLGFQKSLERCVVDGMCPAQNSKFHIFRERITLQIMIRGSYARKIAGFLTALYTMTIVLPVAIAVEFTGRNASTVLEGM